MVALRFADGVIMAGDRRATAGNIIAHRAMEKVFPADRYSAVAIAGTAGMAIEMVRLFQVQLEHYEKVEGVDALPGGQGQPAGPDGAPAPAAWPCRAWPWSRCSPATTLAAATGRIFNYDVTGGHYEEADFQATGSGGRDARSTIKLGCREGLARDEAVELAIQSLYEAADEDCRHRRARPGAGHLPARRRGRRRRLRAGPEAEVAERFGALIERAPATQATRRARCDDACRSTSPPSRS